MKNLIYDFLLPFLLILSKNSISKNQPISQGVIVKTFLVSFENKIRYHLSQKISWFKLFLFIESKNPFQNNANYLSKVFILLRTDFDRFGLSRMVSTESDAIDSIGISAIAITSSWIDLNITMALMIGIFKTSFAEDSWLMSHAVITPKN